MAEDVRTIIQKRLNNVKARMATKLAKRTASGATVASLQVVMGNSGGALFGASHLLTLERGRGPGKVPYGFVGIIKQWIQDKGLSYSSEKDLNSFAGAVAYNLMKKGTAQYRAKRYEDIYTTAIEEETKELAREAAEYIGLQIHKANEKFAKGKNGN